MLRFIRDLLGNSEKDRMGAALDQSIRLKGGDPERLTPEEREALISATRALPDSNDLDGWINHVQQHGASAMTTHHEMMDRAGAYDTQRAQREARDDARRALMAQDVPVPTAAQQAIIDSLPAGAARDVVVASLRTALVFDPVLAPADPDNLTFCGGLPVASRSLIWPHGKDGHGRRRPCHFLCQVAVADIPYDFGLRALFPSDGVLYFFDPVDVTDVSAPLVQHHALDGVVEHRPPPGMVPYSSLYHYHLIPELKTGWQHEESLDVPGHSIRPKWAMQLSMETQAPRSCYAYDDAVDIPEEALADYDGDREQFFETVFAMLNEAVRPEPDERLELSAVDFDGFPHVWGAIQRLLERYVPMIDEAELCYQDRIAANEGRDPSRKIDDTHVKATEAERVEEIARLRSLLSGLDGVRLKIDGWLRLAHENGRATDTNADDREAFEAFWQSLGSDEGLPLDERFASPVGPRNAPWRMEGLLKDELEHSVVGSLCTDPSVFPDDIAEQFRQVVLSRNASSSFGPIQMLGHTAGIQGSEAPGEDLLLMQMPFSRVCDWYFGDCGAVQFWLSHEDFRNRAYDAVQIEAGS